MSHITVRHNMEANCSGPSATHLYLNPLLQVKGLDCELSTMQDLGRRAVILALADTERGGRLLLRLGQKRHITVVRGGTYDNIEVLMYSIACIMLS